MRAAWVVVLVASCGGGGVKDIKDTPPPAPEASCHLAGSKLIDLVVAGQNPPPPDDAVNKLIALVEKRCETDRWSAEARGCFSTVKGIEDADGCAKALTDLQLANLSNDMKPPGEQSGGAEPASADGAGSAGGGSSPGPGTRSPVPKEDKGSGNGASADPCDGGE
ncbi:MAG: hypothetical protein AB7T06_02525 [Kofleriaceae bacterium]